MLATTLAALTALALGTAPAGAAPAAADASRPGAGAPAALPQDPADSLYRAARELMNGGDYRRAADAFARLGERYPKSAYASDALYYRSFSLYRAGGTDDLRAARRSLRTLRGMDSQYRTDAASLDTRVCAELAKRGDAQCAAAVTDIAGVVDAAVVAAGSVAREAVAAASVAMNGPEVQAAIAEAGVVAGHAVAEGVRAGAEGARMAAERLHEASVAMGGGTARARRGGSQECENEDDGEKSIALNALMQLDSARALPIIKRVMARRDRCSELLRRRAVMIVAQRRTADAADILVDAARNDPDREVRQQAVYWLARVPGDKSLNFLRDVATRPGDVEVRKNAIYALSGMKAPEARATLRQVAAANGGDSEVRESAIQWLGSRGTAEDVAYLRELYPRLDSRDLKEKVLHAASRQKGSERWLLDIALDAKEPVELRKQALFNAGNRKEVPLDQLFALYDRVPDRELKEQLIYVYSRRPEPEAVERMIAIARTEKDRELRKTAVGWLARSKDPRAANFLVELIDR
jgi:HEAT repeat protein